MNFPAREELRVVYDAETIQTRIKEMAAEIDAIYKDEPVVVVCVLKGAFMFFTDLVKNLTISPELDFVRLASYGNETESQEHIAFTKDIELSIKDKHVLIVEDIVDSGRSMAFLLHQLEARGAKSLRIAALIDKRERRVVPVYPDFVGFDLPAGFIVGFGLDYAERYRELPAVYVMPDNFS